MNKIISEHINNSSNKSKIIFKDDPILRRDIVEKYNSLSHKKINIWAMNLIDHILEKNCFSELEIKVIKEGVVLNASLRHGEGNVHDLRLIGFKIHKMARESENEVKKVALRAIGQAISSGHMKEHALIASDYAIKHVGLKYKSDMAYITEERRWQLNNLNMITLNEC